MSQNPAQGALLVQRVVWGALLFSQLVYLVVALVIADPSPEAVEEMANNPMPMIFFGIGLVEIGLAVFLIPNIIKPPENPTNVSQLLTSRIVQWAIVESAIILGLVNAFQGGSNTVIIGLFVVSVLAMLKTFPTDIPVSEDSD